MVSLPFSELMCFLAGAGVSAVACRWFFGLGAKAVQRFQAGQPLAEGFVTDQESTTDVEEEEEE